MKKILLAAAAVIMALTLCIGCGNEPSTIDGMWKGSDGSTLTISDGTLTLTDSHGEDLLTGAPLPCEHRGDFLFVEIGGVEVKMFEVALDGDSLTLTYTVEVQADMQATADQSIELTRSDD